MCVCALLSSLCLCAATIMCDINRLRCIILLQKCERRSRQTANVQKKRQIHQFCCVWQVNPHRPGNEASPFLIWLRWWGSCWRGKHDNQHKHKDAGCAINSPNIHLSKVVCRSIPVLVTWPRLPPPHPEHWTAPRLDLMSDHKVAEQQTVTGGRI